MADKSLITQEQMQSDLEQFYSQKIYPYLNGATHAGFTPVGSVIAIMGNEAPNHYLACDGTLYTIADYPQLTAYFEDQFGSVNYFGGNGTTTFAVPDLRGEFLRGTGTNGHSGQGGGSNVGVHQDATEITNSSSENGGLTLFYGTLTSGNISNIRNADKNNTAGSQFLGKSWVHLSKTSGDKNDNIFRAVRPTNTSVLWCIAYENTYIDGSGESSGGGHKIQNEGDLEPLTQRKTMLLNEPLVASDDAEGGNTVVDVDTDVDLSVIHAPGTTGQVDSHIYSTDETVVGKWIDGKPIYEKTVEGTTSSSGNTVINISDLNLDWLVDINSVIFCNDNTWGYSFHKVGSDISSVGLGRNKKSIILYLNYSALLGKLYKVTIQYTKTTDTV